MALNLPSDQLRVVVGISTAPGAGGPSLPEADGAVDIPGSWRRVCWKFLGPHLTSDIPDEADEFASDGSAGLVVMHPAQPEFTEAMAQSYLGLPGNFDHGGRQAVVSCANSRTNACRMAVIPSRLDQQSADATVSRARDRTTLRAVTAGEFGWDEAEVAHQLAGMLEASQIADFSHDGHSGEGIDAAQAHQRLNYGLPAPDISSLQDSGLKAFDSLPGRLHCQVVLRINNPVMRIIKAQVSQKAKMFARPTPSASIGFAQAQQQRHQLLPRASLCVDRTRP